MKKIIGFEKRSYDFTTDNGKRLIGETILLYAIENITEGGAGLRAKAYKLNPKVEILGASNLEGALNQPVVLGTHSAASGGKLEIVDSIAIIKN